MSKALSQLVRRVIDSGVSAREIQRRAQAAGHTTLKHGRVSEMAAGMITAVPTREWLEALADGLGVFRDDVIAAAAEQFWDLAVSETTDGHRVVVSVPSDWPPQKVAEVQRMVEGMIAAS